MMSLLFAPPPWCTDCRWLLGKGSLWNMVYLGRRHQLIGRGYQTLKVVIVVNGVCVLLLLLVVWCCCCVCYYCCVVVAVTCCLVLLLCLLLLLCCCCCYLLSGVVVVCYYCCCDVVYRTDHSWRPLQSLLLSHCHLHVGEETASSWGTYVYYVKCVALS